MKKLVKYAKESNLMNIRIKYGDEVIKFNLFEETKIVENFITKEAITQPSVYSFLTMLHKNLLRDLSFAETQLKREHARIYLKYKKENNPSTGRPYADDYVVNQVLLEPSYQLLEGKLLKLKYNVSIIEASVRTFEQRYSLIQTIAANRRSEKN